MLTFWSTWPNQRIEIITAVCLEVWYTLTSERHYFRTKTISHKEDVFSLSLKFLHSTWSLYCDRNWEKSWNIYYIAQYSFLMTTLLDLVWFWVLRGHHATILLILAYETTVADIWDVHIPYQPHKQSQNTQMSLTTYIKPTLWPDRVTHESETREICWAFWW